MSSLDDNMFLHIDKIQTGLKLKQFRIGCKLKQRDVAEILQVTQTTVSNIECGFVNLTMDNAVKLAQLYDCKLDDFISLKERMQKDEQA